MRVWGLGVCTVDQIIIVDKYPEEDSKIRSKNSILTCGGNIGNTLCAMSKLILQSPDDNYKLDIISKVGCDINGNIIKLDLQKANIDCTKIITHNEYSSSVTYIIVSESNSTRTCIHVPMQEDLIKDEIRTILDNYYRFEVSHNNNNNNEIDLLHLDSRHTEAAIELVIELINTYSSRTLISIDTEKDRPPYFKNLLPLCDIIFSNETFPFTYPHKQTKYNCILKDNDTITCTTTTTDQNNISLDYSFDFLQLINSMTNILLIDNSRTKLMITTMGSKGCVAISKHVDNDNIFNCNSNSVNNHTNTNSILNELIKNNDNATRNGLLNIIHELEQINLDRNILNIRKYTYYAQNHIDKDIKLQVYYCSAIKIPSEDILDTTG